MKAIMTERVSKSRFDEKWKAEFKVKDMYNQLGVKMEIIGSSEDEFAWIFKVEASR